MVIWERMTKRAEAPHHETLHSFVIRAAAAFGRYPVNNLVRIHDVARLAVNAV